MYQGDILEDIRTSTMTCYKIICGFFFLSAFITIRVVCPFKVLATIPSVLSLKQDWCWQLRDFQQKELMIAPVDRDLMQYWHQCKYGNTHSVLMITSMSFSRNLSLICENLNWNLTWSLGAIVCTSCNLASFILHNFRSYILQMFLHLVGTEHPLLS